ncbi:hypothetical protein ACOMHN_061246 [Nucella lapillus]
MSEGEEDSVDLREMLQLQLAEVEMLQSMFSNPGEFTLDSQLVLDELRAFLEGTIDYEVLESRVGFTIKIPTSSLLVSRVGFTIKIPTSSLLVSRVGFAIKIPTSSLLVELSCFFPHEYPSTPPEVFTRAEAMDRKSHSRLTEDLNQYLTSLGTGSLLIGSLVEWLQQNAHVYLHKGSASGEGGNARRKGGKKEEEEFKRLWIYSHHIYNKGKRQSIVDWAGELALTGFSLPGKPGVICVEGSSQSVEEFWYRIRRLNWKRLTIKEEELNLEVVEGKGHTYHMDLGKFRHFLQEHGFAHIFTLYFGVEGKSAGD